MLRIMLADDHHVTRRGLRDLLEEKPEWKVCGEASNGREAVEMAAALMPHIAIVDLSMPELNGLEATRQIVKSTPGTAVLIYTMDESEKVVHEVLAAGAKGIVLKSELASSMVQAVETIAQGKPFFTSRVAETVLNAYLAQRAGADDVEAPTFDALTARERQVMQLLAEGKNNKDVATILDISTRTAQAHHAEIMHKLKLKSLSELVRYAIRNGLIRP
jgi:DNA-binding NarL/FixJ family response regulator